MIIITLELTEQNFIIIVITFTNFEVLGYISQFTGLLIAK